MRRLAALLALALLPAPAGAAGGADGRLFLRDALVAEMDRSLARLRMDGFEAPYFIAYTLRDGESVEITAKTGAILSSDRERRRRVAVELRVGDYQFDNTADPGESDWAPGADELYDPGEGVPLDDNAVALRAALWLITDARYKAALALLHQKRGHRATRTVEDESLASFSATPATSAIDRPLALVVDVPAWEKQLRAASARFRAYPEIFDAAVHLQATHETRIFVTSEGTRLITERVLWALHLEAYARAADGVLVDHGRSFYGASAAELPGPQQLGAECERLAAELLAIRVAPTLDPFTGPALLMEEATGVLFHEVLGHRLEGEHMASDDEGGTFKGRLGQPILPTFLDLVDDPTAIRVGGRSLNGTYRFDDEGVAAEPTVLVEQGVLKGFLTSRRPVAGGLRSNGHGRADGGADPMARMGNLFVRSSKAVPAAELRRLFLEEIRRQGKPFGLIIRDISGGSTNTATYGYQAFKGVPRLAYKVDAATGAETLVRGIEMVGTPLAAINKISVTGDSPGVFNGFCGAESGWVPVSAIAPAVLMTEVEVQRGTRTRQKPLVLPPPWSEPSGK